MIERGKFRSLTLVNWNGFFARTFDLDELVTTLSGGNGAGKSTTMAAFVTALIPDLTLLHFRNTTEAGATSGSRDKGLHGKLRAGVCTFPEQGRRDADRLCHSTGVGGLHGEQLVFAALSPLCDHYRGVYHREFGPRGIYLHHQPSFTFHFHVVSSFWAGVSLPSFPHAMRRVREGCGE